MILHRLFFDENDWYRYTLEGEHAWSMPPVRCGVCGSVWRTTGAAYPAVEVGGIASEYPLETMKPLGNEEMEALQARLRPLVPPGAPLQPGTDFGAFRAAARGRFEDFAWAAYWTVLLRSDAERRLRDWGINLPPSHAAELEWTGKGEPPLLLEPQALPLVDLSRRGATNPEAVQCARCGRLALSFRTMMMDADTRLPDGVDLCRGKNNPAVFIVSERFAQAVRELELTGCVVEPFPTT